MQFFCNLNSPQKITRPLGKLRTEFTSPIAKSTSPRLSDTTFFAPCDKFIFAIFCVEFPQVQCIDLSEVVHVVKDDIIVICVHLRLLTLFVVTCFLSAKVSPEWRLNLSFAFFK